jgi:hypothetical protein
MSAIRKIVAALVSRALDKVPAEDSGSTVRVDRVVVEIAAGRTFWLAFGLGALFGEGVRELLPLLLRLPQ